MAGQNRWSQAGERKTVSLEKDAGGGAVACEAVGYRSVQTALGQWLHHVVVRQGSKQHDGYGRHAALAT